MDGRVVEGEPTAKRAGRADEETRGNCCGGEVHGELRRSRDAACTRIKWLHADAVPGGCRTEINDVCGIPLLAKNEGITNGVGEEGSAVLTQDEVGLRRAEAAVVRGDRVLDPGIVLTARPTEVDVAAVRARLFPPEGRAVLRVEIEARQCDYWVAEGDVMQRLDAPPGGSGRHSFGRRVARLQHRRGG